MVLSKQKPKLGDVVAGMFTMETQPYFKKEGEQIKEQKEKISFYFKCKVADQFWF
jgi:hypothetical protein